MDNIENNYSKGFRGSPTVAYNFLKLVLDIIVPTVSTLLLKLGKTVFKMFHILNCGFRMVVLLWV